MGARHPRDLVAWQLAHELKLQVYALIARPAVRRDVRFCEQIREASASAETHIAEAF
jgi:four helix bundle protein